MPDITDLSSAYNTLTTNVPQNQSDQYDYTQSRNDVNTFFQYRKPVKDPVVTGYTYSFFTSPDLNLNDPLNMQSLNISGTSIYPSAIVNLLSGATSGKFIPLLTNRAISAPASDEVLSTIDYSETWNKYKILLGTTAKDSRVAGTCTVNFQDDQYLTVMKLFKLWTDYIEKVYLGRIYSNYAKQQSSIGALSQYIDYMSSLYVFSTLPDGETLSHWSKYTGIFPLKNSWGDFAADDGSQDVKRSFPMEFGFSYKEDMTPLILQDFNLLSSDSMAIMSPSTNSHKNNMNLKEVSSTYQPYIAFNNKSFSGTGQFESMYNSSNTFKLVLPSTT